MDVGRMLRDKLYWEGWRLRALPSRWASREFLTGTPVRKIPGLRRLGSRHCGWTIPVQLLPTNAICYCAGVGEDITFDLELIAQYGCEVYAFDPTPCAIRHVQTHAADIRQFHFYEIGLWDNEEILRFYAPQGHAFISYSALNLQQTLDFIEAPCRRLSAIMRECGHARLDLLKLDIEGAEYRVIESLIEDQLDIGILCVEYDEANHHVDQSYRDRVRRSVASLCHYGYALVAAKTRCNLTFVKDGLL